jgi:hypothetical protein
MILSLVPALLVSRQRLRTTATKSNFCDLDAEGNVVKINTTVPGIVMNMLINSTWL